MREALLRLPDVEVVQADEGQVTLAASAASGRLPAIFDALRAAGADAREVTLTQPNLESLFLALTGRRYDVEGIEVGEVVGAAEGVTSGSGPVPEKERP